MNRYPEVAVWVLLFLTGVYLGAGLPGGEVYLTGSVIVKAMVVLSRRARP